MSTQRGRVSQPVNRIVGALRRIFMWAWDALLRLFAWARDSLRLTETRALLAVCAGALLLHLWPLQALSTNYDEGMYWSSLRAMVVGYARYNPIFHSQPPVFLASVYPLYLLFGQASACRAHRHYALCARRHCGRLFRRARAGWTLGGRGDGGAAGAQSALPGDDAHPAAGRARARAGAGRAGLRAGGSGAHGPAASLAGAGERDRARSGGAYHLCGGADAPARAALPRRADVYLDDLARWTCSHAAARLAPGRRAGGGARSALVRGGRARRGDSHAATLRYTATGVMESDSARSA